MCQVFGLTHMAIEMDSAQRGRNGRENRENAEAETEGGAYFYEN